MREVGPPTILGRPNDMIARMRKSGGKETAIIVPLRPDIRNAMPFIVGKPEDMAIAAGRFGMNAMCAV